MLTQERIKQLLDYDPETGIFRWRMRVAQRVQIGDVAGTRHCAGYVAICVDGFPRLAHRLAWLYVYGYMPEQVDHINHARADNWIKNLREANYQINTRNKLLSKGNVAGHAGVASVPSGRWCAKIGRKHLGTFNSFDEAVAARKEAEVHFGYHNNHGHPSKVPA